VIDKVWDESPMMRRVRVETRMQTLRDAVVTVVCARFPSLADLARQHVVQVDTLEMLCDLITLFSVIPDEAMVRSLLSSTIVWEGCQ